MRVKRNNNIHKTAIIENGAKIASDVVVGPFCIVGSNVEIQDGTILESNVVIKGRTTIGKNNKIFPFVVIGEIPQDLKYENEDSEIIIGDNNLIREHCTIHIGTKGDNMITKIGSNNLFMVNTHIAHDCIIGNNCILANNATLAGHVHIEDSVVIGGLCAIHQHVKIGEGAILGGMSALGEDLIPYGASYTTSGRKASLQGLNLTGLKRANFDKTIIKEALHFYKDVFESNNNSIIGNISEYKKKYKKNIIINKIISFLESDTIRQFCTSTKNK